ncbi:inner-membrane translocator [Sulfolobus islandicus Y.G.57.14]|uniref:ABC-type branched-chain amino acid transport system, permease component n=6 Tax=Saccharolobus islandicus TaxID=43080 RepID=M9UC82_SACIS|nr:branched-chain amino acid ABC transporter permease [Sulfolobus islandicus]ACP36578.1 inner-membrane translocator [Sulfolobus islandicus L.S.2.15]ACP46842.1 inner-membrane translocator [Sulfolobus islandicus Y.G.57.14]ADB88377.1 inner-membrane translocator [Sulfolobus islandicus L.D.8.5]ADX83743.1 inner-membrane translocator [Sulfolobus islandicus HVE10/4]ADX86399.1 inner-membrane translocator [Sulfolobus islandicus REY15A]
MAVDISSLILAIVLDFSVYLMVVISLNVEIGLTGVPNFGRVLAYAGGAFIAGAIPGRILQLIYGLHSDYILNNPSVIAEINDKLLQQPLMALAILILTLILAGIVGAALGYISSYPALRLREDYLGILLLVAGTSLVVIGITYPPIVGGTVGVQVPAVFNALLGQGSSLYYKISIVLLAFSLVMLLLFNLTSNSPMGRVFRAVRENEDLVEVLGRDIGVIRGKAMALGGFLAGIAGSLYAFYIGSVFAGAFDNLTWSFNPYLMLVLGGAGTSIGAMLGALIYSTLYHVIDLYKQTIGYYLHFDAVWLQYMLFGLILTIILIIRPQGIVVEKAKPLVKPKAKDEEKLTS